MHLTCYTILFFYLAGVKAVSKKIEYESNEVSSQDTQEVSERPKMEQDLVLAPNEHAITRSTFV